MEALPLGPLLGIDYGSVRIGLALCDRDQKIAIPFQLYERHKRHEEAEFYQALVKKERLAGIVMGLPVHLSGSESPKSREVRKYAQWLGEVTGLPITFSDERFSSAFAWDELKAGGLKASQRKKQLDKVAAQIMLQAYLDSPRNITILSGVEFLDHPQPSLE